MAPELPENLESECIAASSKRAQALASRNPVAAVADLTTEEAAEIKAKADAELEEALPAMEAAQEAVNCLAIETEVAGIL